MDSITFKGPWSFASCIAAKTSEHHGKMFAVFLLPIKRNENDDTYLNKYSPMI